MNKTILEIERAQRGVEIVRASYLESKGWTYTSKTPGCYWLWEKTLSDGRIVLAGAALAAYLQFALDAETSEDK